jgi:hypothetical protein
MVQVASRRRKPASVTREFPDSVVVDVTTRGPQPWVQLTPFYPHGGNENIDDLPSPPSHTALIARYLTGRWPSSIGWTP